MPNTEEAKITAHIPPKPISQEAHQDDLERHLIDAWRRGNEEATPEEASEA